MIVYLNPETGVEFADVAPKQDVEILVQGVIYNHRMVIDAYAPGRNIETAIINIYTKHGFRHAMFMLDGEFAVILYDRTQNKVYAARDPYGVCFLYVVPPIMGSSTWVITDKKTLVKPLTIGTYSSFIMFDNTWQVSESEVRYHTIPLYSTKVVKAPVSLSALSFHYLQYLKYAVQKRIQPNKMYYINYDDSKDQLCFLLAWVVVQLYPALDFSIFVNDYNNVSAQWHDVFGERIRMYSMNHDISVEISPEDILMANYSEESESELLYEVRKRLELYNGLPHKSIHTKCIRPFMDTSLIDFYLTEVPPGLRMSGALFRDVQSIITYLPELLTRV